MALKSFGIVGKLNEPLFLLDIPQSTEDEEVPETEEDGNNNDNDSDIFGFGDQKGALSMQHEKLMMHAALDRLEEITGSKPRWRTRVGTDTKWIGLLCPMDNNFIYGYVTSTNIKFLAMVRESMDPSQEVHLKTLFAKVHNCYVEYTLNPFSQLNMKIASKRFSSGVLEAIKEYNAKKGISWA